MTASTATSLVYSAKISAVQRIYFDQNWGPGYVLPLCLSIQFIGYAFAGFSRAALVKPASMIYPDLLVKCNLFNVLHGHYGASVFGDNAARLRFFIFTLAGSFVWFWFPGYLFTALSMFNWACWIAPRNVVVNQLFGTVSGLGMGLLTFDWSMISYCGPPLVMPVRLSPMTLLGSHY